jgi:DedD protein
MDPRAKQRLTGAIILVALFVLLVPELLTGPKSTGAPRTAEDEGLRRYTIDLDTPRAVNTPAAEADVALPPVANAPAESQRAVPGEAAVAEPPSTAVAEAPAAASPSEPATVQPAPPTPAPEPRPTTSPPARGSFVVQLGSFGSRDNAERLVRDMTAKGFKTFIAPITTNGRELYRVRVGPTRDRASAEALATQLKRVGQSGSIVPIS